MKIGDVNHLGVFVFELSAVLVMYHERRADL